MRGISLVFIAFLFCFLCSPGMALALNLLSDAFAEGEKLPDNAGYKRGNVSPALMWKYIPENTRSFALIMDDPDARGWVHWLIYNIPSDVASLKENLHLSEELEDGTRQGMNDFGKIGYGGPCPPSGTHCYVFRLFALDAVLDLEPGTSKSSLLKAMEGHIIAEAQLAGRYSH